MLGYKITQRTSLNDLELRELPLPQPGRGEVLVELRAAALNHRDLGMLDWDPDCEFVIGSDGSGVITEVGPGVSGWENGQEVIINPALDWGASQEAFAPGFTILGWPRDGTLAQAITIPAQNIFPKPPHLNFKQSAALPLAGLTAYRSVHKRAKVGAGETVLIHGIGGGVALFALQFAVSAGARVAVTSTSDSKLARALDLGADFGINSRNQDWTAETLAWTADRGVDVVIDSVGGELFAASLSVVRPGGRIVTYGTTAYPHAKIDLGTLFWHQLNLLGSTMGSPQDFSDMLDFVNQTGLEPIIDSIWPLNQGQAALRHLAAGRQFGKVVVTCS